MQMLDQKKLNIFKRLRKSQILLIGSLLVFIGFLFVSWNFFITLRDEVYSDLKIDAVMGKDTNNTIQNIPVAANIQSEEIVENTETIEEEKEVPIDYDKYLGVLEIPRIGLKKGFYNLDNRYNNIQYNVTLVETSTMPDVDHGNLILMAHSGDAYISYFAYLYRLNVGDYAYITYNKVKYTYKIVDIYEVPKVGYVTINRDYDKTCLTLITCTKDNDNTQTVYIAEQV